MIWNKDYEVQYNEMVNDVFTQLDPNKIDSVTIGGFRLPKDFYKSMRNLFPDHGLFSAGLTDNDGMVTYRKSIEVEVLNSVISNVKKYMSDEKIYSYPTHKDE